MMPTGYCLGCQSNSKYRLLMFQKYHNFCSKNKKKVPQFVTGLWIHVLGLCSNNLNQISSIFLLLLLFILIIFHLYIYFLDNYSKITYGICWFSKKKKATVYVLHVFGCMFIMFKICVNGEIPISVFDLSPLSSCVFLLSFPWKGQQKYTFTPIFNGGVFWETNFMWIKWYFSNYE